MRKVGLGLIIVLLGVIGNVFGKTEDNELIPPKARKIIVFREGVDLGKRTALFIIKRGQVLFCQKS